MADGEDDMRICPVCLEDYRELGDTVPRLLPCTHTVPLKADPEQCCSVSGMQRDAPSGEWKPEFSSKQVYYHSLEDKFNKCLLRFQWQP